jgi:hypothetical protein
VDDGQRATARLALRRSRGVRRLRHHERVVALWTLDDLRMFIELAPSKLKSQLVAKAFASSALTGC